MNELKRSAISGVFWVMAERFGIQAINFLVSIALARLLLPKDFGTVGIVTVFISIAQVIVDGGLAGSLIRTKHPSPADYAVVFISNLLVSILLYAVLFFTAPLIADYFNMPELTLLIRVLSLVLVIRSLAIIQITRLIMTMNFKKHMTIQIPSVLAGGITGLLMAFYGYGLWSLVGSQLASAVVYTVQLWLRSNWQPQLLFEKQLFLKHLGYGSNLMGSQLIKVLFDNVNNFLIAKVYSPVQLGFYSRAYSLRQIPVETFASALSNVTFPLFSRLQDDVQGLRNAYNKVTQQVFFVIAPLFLLLIALAEPVFRFLFTDKWLPAVPYFQLLCVAGLILPFNLYNGNILNARGKAPLMFRLEIIKRAVLAAALFSFYRYGVYALIFVQIGYVVLAFLLNSYFLGREIRQSARSQVSQLLPIFLCAVLAGGLTWFADSMVHLSSDLLRLAAWGLPGLLLYLLLTVVLKVPAYFEFRAIITGGWRKITSQYLGRTNRGLNG
jgi:O-antigen/teichoic acid export membrane protein